MSFKNKEVMASRDNHQNPLYIEYDLNNDSDEEERYQQRIDI